MRIPLPGSKCNHEGTKNAKGITKTVSRVHMLYKTTPACSPEVEAIVERTIGCALRVHRALGPGYKEAIYHDAFEIDAHSKASAATASWSFSCITAANHSAHIKLDLVVERSGGGRTEGGRTTDEGPRGAAALVPESGQLQGRIVDELQLGLAEIVTTDDSSCEARRQSIVLRARFAFFVAFVVAFTDSPPPPRSSPATPARRGLRS